MVVAGVLLTACGTIGSGTLATEDRQVPAFDEISVSDGIDLELIVDPATSTKVVVTYDDNLIDRIKTEVVNGELAISAEGSFNIIGSGRSVSVSVPDLVRLSASGGTDVIGNGELADLTLEASGGADVDLSELPVRRVTVNASGGADVTVRPLDSIVGEASGGSNLDIEGNPDVIDVETSGGADVN